jgi:hypothetical protein
VSTVSLTELFERERHPLVAELGTRPDPHTVLAAMRKLFDRLAEQTDVEQARLMLGALRNGVVGSLFALRVETTEPRYRAEPRQQNRNPLEAIGSLFTRAPDRPPPPPPPPTSTVDVTRLVDQLCASFEAADRVLAAAEPPPPVVVPVTWSEDAELLDLCQDLLEAQTRGDGELALSHVERIRRSLPLRHRIDVVTFDGANDELFKFRISTNPSDTEPVTIRPALRSGTRILRRGEVTRPAKPDGDTEDQPVPTGTTIEEGGGHDGE